MRAAVSPASAKLLKAVSVPNKLNLLLLLEKAPHCVCDLMAHTRASQTLISHHLSEFAAEGLVQSERSGAFVDYSLTKKGRKLVRAVRTLAG